MQFSQYKNFEKLLSSTGVVKSEETTHVYYEGPELESSTRYYFRVKIWDNHEESSDYSEISFFETTLLYSCEWKGKFITPESIDDGKRSKGKLLRDEFELFEEVESACVYATALGMYELHINGNRIGEALFTPGWTAYKTRRE